MLIWTHTLTRIPGSVLQRQLQDSGGPLHDGMKLMRHIIEHKIDGQLRQLFWLHEDSTLEHEYLILSIFVPGNDQLSWLRMERLGLIGSGGSNAETKDARLEITLSPRFNDLLNHSDKVIESVEFDSDPPRLVDLAHFIVILCEEMPEYTLTNHNCWWFARRIFVVLVRNYLPESPQKQKMIKHTLARFFGYSVDDDRLLLGMLTIYLASTVWPMVKICLRPDTLKVFGLRTAAMTVLGTEMKVHIRFKKYISSNTSAQRTVQDDTYEGNLPDTIPLKTS